MRMIDIIEKKKKGEVLSREEISFFVTGYTKGEIPDYQASAFTMAVLFQGLNKEETAILTDCMMHSGDVIDLSAIEGVKVDKHSTGGVGDKTSLVLGPLVASCGAKVAKMSGRGLGHTGGTLDKLESIRGMSVSLSREAFIEQVSRDGIAIIGQTGDLVPADKKLYALRDVTATVDSIPLIASSIMSKKLASGSDTILLDVKFGSGAFMKTLEDAVTLASAMVEIGKSLGRDTRAVITDMDQPLGFAVGNIVEVKEAVETLRGRGPKDLEELCVSLGAIMLDQAGIEHDPDKAKALLRQKIANGEAYAKLKAMVRAQGGDTSQLDDPSRFTDVAGAQAVYAPKTGYIHAIEALTVGEVAMHLGAGRATKEDTIDMAAGVVLHKKIGDFVKEGDVLATVYTNKEEISPIIDMFTRAFVIRDGAAKQNPLIYTVIE
ncbi:MAG: pyrimidine-nucleoside phosphorylase [Clostridia bacterium]|nr:pyrimidine-nucleoside phosphorylase [Clostridia bacterium]